MHILFATLVRFLLAWYAVSPFLVLAWVHCFGDVHWIHVTISHKVIGLASETPCWYCSCGSSYDLRHFSGRHHQMHQFTQRLRWENCSSSSWNLTRTTCASVPSRPCPAKRRGQQWVAAVYFVIPFATRVCSNHFHSIFSCLPSFWREHVVDSSINWRISNNKRRTLMSQTLGLINH